MTERKSILLRLDPAVHDALARWAADELRSTTAQIEFLLRQGLAQAGRLPRNVGGMPRRGRPPKNADDGQDAAAPGEAAEAGDVGEGSDAARAAEPGRSAPSPDAADSQG